MSKAAKTITTPDPSGAIHQSRLEQADARILALGAELRENRATVDAESDRADVLQEANPDDAETRAAAWAIRDALRPLTVRFHEILNAMRDTPAYTVAGMAMKAEAIMLWLSPGGEVPDDGEDSRVAWSLARDVLRMSGAKGLSCVEIPDAGLIAACELFLERQVEQDARNRRRGVTDEENNLGTKLWDEALHDVLGQPDPSTQAGRVALARAAWAALHDEATPFVDQTLEEQASTEKLLALRALAAVGSAS